MQSNHNHSQAPINAMQVVQQIARELPKNQSVEQAHFNFEMPPSLRRYEPGTVVESAMCAVHGEYPLRIATQGGRVASIPGGRCPACAKQQRAAVVLGDACVPESHRHCSFSSYKPACDAQQLAFDDCLGYAENFNDHAAAGRCLILFGNQGTGKNHLATSIVLRVMKHGRTAQYAKAGDLLQRYWGKSLGDEKLDFIGSLAAVDVLWIDELGRHSLASSARDFFFDLIDERRKRMRPIIITTNMDIEAVAAFLGDAAMSRLRENGGIGVPFYWGDYRAGELS